MREVVECCGQADKSTALSVQQNVGSGAVTLVFLSKTFYYNNYFSPPRSELVPVRPNMVLVIDLAK